MKHTASRKGNPLRQITALRRVLASTEPAEPYLAGSKKIQCSRIVKRPLFQNRLTKQNRHNRTYQKNIGLSLAAPAALVRVPTSVVVAQGGGSAVT